MLTRNQQLSRLLVATILATSMVVSVESTSYAQSLNSNSEDTSTPSRNPSPLYCPRPVWFGPFLFCWGGF